MTGAEGEGSTSKDLRTQQDGQLHLDGVEELQLRARAVPGGVDAERIWRGALHGQALAVGGRAELLVEVHLHAVVDLSCTEHAPH